MERLLAVLTVCCLTACASSSSLPRKSEPPKPIECTNCNNVGMKIYQCAVTNASCSAACTGEPAEVAACQGMCQAQYGACVGQASIPDCPAYCN